MSRQSVPGKYLKGWADGKADRFPDSAELAYGSHVLNSYERGYIDSGYFDEPQEGPLSGADGRAAGHG